MAQPLQQPNDWRRRYEWQGRVDWTLPYPSAAKAPLRVEWSQPCDPDKWLDPDEQIALADYLAQLGDA